MKISAADSSINELFCRVGEIPEFPGGRAKLIAFALNNLKYPETAVRDSVEGTVILEFTIDEQGQVINSKAAQSVRHDIDAACLRMLAKMPKWQPGRLSGKPVAVYERWKIIFRLTD